MHVLSALFIRPELHKNCNIRDISCLSEQSVSGETNAYNLQLLTGGRSGGPCTLTSLTVPSFGYSER
jgi:hypothetical protein